MTTLIPKFDLKNGGAAPTGAVNRTTYEKLADTVSVKDFGATGDGTTDDTVAIQNALDSGNSLYFPDGVYKTSARLTVTTPNIVVCGPGIIKPSATWAGTGTTLSVLTIALAAENVHVDGIAIDSDDTVIGSQINFQLESFAYHTVVTNCTFINSVMIGGASGSSVAFRTTSDKSQAVNNYFAETQGAIFVQGADCILSDNICVNPNDGALVLNGAGCTGCIVSNNIISNDAGNSLSGAILVEEAANQWIIEGNKILGVTGAGISCLNVAVFTLARGGIIRNNIINGGSLANTGVVNGISCSEYYTNLTIIGNQIFGISSSSSNSRVLLIPASGGIVANNIIDGTASTGFVAVTEIVTATTNSQSMIFENNISTAPTSGRHILFGADDFNFINVSFIGGKFFDGSEGINTATNNPTNLSVWVENISESTATNFVNTGANLAWGDRQNYFDTHYAVNFPHSVKEQTVMYGNYIPAAGTWAAGDTIYKTIPIVGQPKGWVCTVAGSPGTWVSIGNL